MRTWLNLDTWINPLNCIQPNANRVAHNLEIISEKFQFSTRILMGFTIGTIYSLVLIADPIGRNLVGWIFLEIISRFYATLPTAIGCTSVNLIASPNFIMSHTWHKWITPDSHVDTYMLQIAPLCVIIKLSEVLQIDHVTHMTHMTQLHHIRFRFRHLHVASCATLCHNHVEWGTANWHSTWFPQSCLAHL